MREVFVDDSMVGSKVVVFLSVKNRTHWYCEAAYQHQHRIYGHLVYDTLSKSCLAYLQFLYLLLHRVLWAAR
jgi:hypothetical protein